MECDNCGRIVMAKERTCPYCGQVNDVPKQTVAIFVALALVAVGLVWFFLGTA